MLGSCTQSKEYTLRLSGRRALHCRPYSSTTHSQCDHLRDSSLEPRVVCTQHRRSAGPVPQTRSPPKPQGWDWKQGISVRHTCALFARHPGYYTLYQVPRTAPVAGVIIMVPILQMNKLTHTALWNMPHSLRWKALSAFCIHRGSVPVDSTNCTSVVWNPRIQKVYCTRPFYIKT